MANNSLMFLISTLVASAFLGSWHCGMMCGPLASFAGQKKSLFYYHAGRLISYSLLGLICGWLGKHFVLSANLELKVVLFILLSTLILALAYFSQNSLLLNHSTGNNFSKKYSIQKKAIRFFMQKSQNEKWQKFGFWGLGLSSVLLPCGWLYSFVVASAATQSPWAGALVMFLFSLSSIPALQAFPFFLNKLSSNTNPRQKRIVTLVVLGSSLYSLFSHFFIS